MPERHAIARARGARVIVPASDASAMVHVVILIAGEPPREIRVARGSFAAWIAIGLGPAVRCASHDIRTPAPLPGPRDADAFLITGSSASVTERAAWVLRGEELLRRIAHARVPLFGICFGHQMIAQALGGLVERNPRGREIGTVRLHREADDPLFAGLPRRFDVNATHVDTVTKLPPGAEVLATTALDRAAAFRVGPRVHGVQFHPEFDADIMRRYLAARAHLVRQEGGDPDALRAHVHGGTRGRDILHNFARQLSSR
jgi:GMP synthase (glutamine-hydrolysing)